MKNFRNGQRVQVVNGPLSGMKGTVVRIRKGDNGAWFKCDIRPMDSKIAGMFPFPIGDDRSNHTIIYPGECLPE